MGSPRVGKLKGTDCENGYEVFWSIENYRRERLWACV